MKSLHLLAIIGIVALAACVTTLQAEEKLIEDESLGKITLGLKADKVTTLTGKPEAKGKDEISILGASFNRMRRSLQKAMQMLES